MIANASKTPPVWSDEDLETHARSALQNFVRRRLDEPRDRYVHHVETERAAILILFQELKGVDPDNPDLDIVRDILTDDMLFSTLRYVAGPPVSEDDLAVLATESTARLTKSLLRQDPVVQKVLNLICQLSDPYRFPWIEERRAATSQELRKAIDATAVLHASARLQTERRSFGRQVEQDFIEKLEQIGYTRSAPPAGGRIDTPAHYPPVHQFYGEVTLYGRKADIVIRIPDERVIAVEAKDSSSAINSIKRVLNDTAAKARAWHVDAGRQIIPVALLSGVFGVDKLKDAQSQGLYLAWLHQLDSFISWIESQG